MGYINTDEKTELQSNVWKPGSAQPSKNLKAFGDFTPSMLSTFVGPGPCFVSGVLL